MRKDERLARVDHAAHANDAAALVLAAHFADLVGVTTVGGNAPLHDVTVNALLAAQIFDIDVDDDLTPRQTVTVTATKTDGEKVVFAAVARVDTPIEVDYLRNGGILHYVLRRMAAD